MLGIPVLVGTLAVLVALYFMLAPRFNYGIYRPFLFHPHKLDSIDGAAPELGGVQGEEISFSDSDGYKIYGWYFKQPKSKLTIVYSHGNGGNITYREGTVSLLLRTGASVLVYDYRGFGRSEGLPTVEGICDDATAAYDYLHKSKGVSTDQIVLYGESLGVGVSTYLSSVRPCAGLILQSGFSSLRKISLEVMPGLAIYPPQLFPSQTLDSVAVLKAKHAPLLIIHGQQDMIVPFHHAEELYASASEPKHMLTLAQCGHNDMCVAAPDEYYVAVSEFLSGLSHSTAVRPPMSVEPGA